MYCAVARRGSRCAMTDPWRTAGHHSHVHIALWCTLWLPWHGTAALCRLQCIIALYVLHCGMHAMVMYVLHHLYCIAPNCGSNGVPCASPGAPWHCIIARGALQCMWLPRRATAMSHWAAAHHGDVCIALQLATAPTACHSRPTTRHDGLQPVSSGRSGAT